MRLDRLTNKTREALLTASQHAAEHGHPEVHPEHLLVALFAQDGGLAPAILTKAGADPRAIAKKAIERTARLPKVEGGAEPSLNRELRSLRLPPSPPVITRTSFPKPPWQTLCPGRALGKITRYGWREF